MATGRLHTLAALESARLTEIVRRAHNGIVVDRPGVPAYADALRILLNSRELRETFARNGPIEADCYNLHVAVSNHLSMYHDVVHA